jgi:hypothetical protein
MSSCGLLDLKLVYCCIKMNVEVPVVCKKTNKLLPIAKFC